MEELLESRLCLRTHAVCMATCKAADAAEQAFLPVAGMHSYVVHRLQRHRVSAAECPQRTEEVRLILRLKTGHCCIIAAGIAAGVHR